MGTGARRFLGWSAWTAAIGLLLLSGCDGDRPDVAGDLLNAFGGTCSSVGLWTRSALKQNDALVQTLQNLVNDQDCKDYVNSLMTVQNAVSQTNLLLKDDSFLQYRADEEQIQDLSLALAPVASQSSSGFDPDLVTQLKSQLILTQLDLYRTNAMERASQTVADKNRYAQATASLSQYLQTITTAAQQQSGGIASCLRKHPEAAVGIAGNLLALGGSFVSPVYGAGFSMIGQVLSIGVDYASHSTTEDAIWDLHAARMPTALTCGLESMTELFCDAEDSFELLELKRDSVHNGTGHTAPIWRGVDLLSNRMPVLNEWLAKVRNGIIPTDSGMVVKQNAILDKMTSVDKMHNSVSGSLSEDQLSYKDAAQEQKANVMVKTILDQVYLVLGVSQSCMGCGTAVTPFTEMTTDPKNYACWFVLGVNASCPLTDNNEPLEKYIREKLVPKAVFANLFSNWNDIYGAVKAKVDAEFSRTITANPSSLIADAYESSPTNVSPRDVLKMLVDYIGDLKSTGGQDNPAYKPHLDETIQLINDILASLDPSVPASGDGPSKTDPSVKKIAEIFHALELNRGISIFSDRISRIVQWDLNSKIKSGQFPKDLTEILMLAGSGLNDRLTQASQGATDGALGDDLGTAQAIAQENIGIFRKAFSKSMGKTVEMLHQSALEAGESERGPNRPNGQMLGHLCTLILATGNSWPSGFDPSICEKAYLDPLYGGVGSPAFSIEVGKLAKELEGKPFKTRFCAYHRYMRAERLAELPPIHGRKELLESRQLGWTQFDLMGMMLGN